MASESDVWLHSASVVVLAESHNPSILNKDFLVMHGIVPKEWNVVETVVTPVLSLVRYANGIRLQIDGQRLEIVEECDLPFHGYTNDRLYDLAVSYVETLPHVPYSGLGINYTVSIIRPDPPQQITRRFLKSGPWSEEFHMMPRFSASMQEAVLNLGVHSKDMLREGNSESSVVVDCNLHYGKRFDASSLCDKIRGWANEKERIADALDKILGDWK